MSILKKLQDKIVDYVFTVSKQPVLFRDLLRANVLFNEHMHVDPALLNFRKNLAHVYVVYSIICVVFLLPLTVLVHTIFKDIDIHFTITGTVVATSAVFMGFDMFYMWIRKAITQKLIKTAWQNHFPYFPYEKYNEKVEYLYNKAKKEEVPKANLERFILDNLVGDK